MNDNETYEFESRRYIEPTLSSGEQGKFIDNFRDIQNQKNQQIATDTYNLGTAVPSNLGGLGGGESYFNQRYQTDQVDDMVSNLKTAMQAQALKDVSTNWQNQLKQRYTKAQQAYTRRQAKRANSAGNDLANLLSKLFGGGGSSGDGDVDEEDITGATGITKGRLRTSPYDSDLKPGRSYSTVAGGAGNRYYFTYDDATGLVAKTNDPTYTKHGDIYIPNSVYEQMMSAKTTPIIGGVLGNAAANAILQNYINSRGKK